MSRAPNGGWDFVKVGNEYQYKEDGFIATVLILEDTSTPEEYRFKLQVLESNYPAPDDSFNISHAKKCGYWNDMKQFYEKPKYIMLPIGTPWPYNYRDKKNEAKETR